MLLSGVMIDEKLSKNFDSKLVNYVNISMYLGRKGIVKSISRRTNLHVFLARGV
ncbi:MAG: hypothetical protein K0S25_1666 [Bacillus sp. (in: firmicutes)]|jgi:hypothetical protein|nr:hypothetical protein [Bacillus sp. (in: firmicutes)]